MSGEPSSEPEIARAIEALAWAPRSGSWPSALEAIVAAVGGSAGQICAMSPRGGASFGVAAGLPPETLKLFNRLKGGNPSVNPRAAAVYGARPLQVVIDNGASNGAGFYRDFYHRVDAPFACFARLDDVEECASVITIFRSAALGPATGRQSERLGRLLPHISSAIAAEGDIARRTLEATARLWDEAEIAAFYCDSRLRVQAMSEHGERTVAAGRIVSLRAGRLTLSGGEKQRKLASAVANAANHFARERRARFAAGSADGSVSCRICVAPLLDGMRLPPSPEVLVLLLNVGAPSNLEGLRAAGLTEAEVDIARRLVEIQTTREIAEARGASIATVQTQIKAMHAKLGVSHRAELIKVLRTLIS